MAQSSLKQQLFFLGSLLKRISSSRIKRARGVAFFKNNKLSYTFLKI